VCPTKIRTVQGSCTDCQLSATLDGEFPGYFCNSDECKPS
jgi:hypothetical protein